MEQQTDTTQSQETNNHLTQDPAASINHLSLEAYKDQLRPEQNLPLAIAAAVVASLVSAGLWAAITVATEYQIGYMAIAVGLIVGFSVRFVGKGIDQVFGVIGAVFALLGCLVGNYLSMVGFAADAEGLTYIDTLLLIDISLIPSIMAETFSPMDILFYGLAVYEGYRFSFRAIDEEELAQQGIA